MSLVYVLSGVQFHRVSPHSSATVGLTIAEGSNIFIRDTSIRCVLYIKMFSKSLRE